MWNMILEGFGWGLFIVAAMLPVVAFSIIVTLFVGIMTPKPKELMYEDEPELPENDEPDEPEPPPRYRFVAGTIVRPPNVIKREDKDDS